MCVWKNANDEVHLLLLARADCMQMWEIVSPGLFWCVSNEFFAKQQKLSTQDNDLLTAKL